MKLTRRTLFQSLALPLAVPGMASPARTDTDGMLLIDGKRTFALGLYQLPNGPDGWRRAADAGFQFTHVNAKAGELDAAREHGLYGWISVGSIAPERRAADEERIRKTVAAFQRHPALLFWETEDEPSYTWHKLEPRVKPEVIRETYRFLKSLDPAHPVYLNHAPVNLASTLRRYNPGGDIIATDIYPVTPHGIRPMYALWEDGRQGDFLNAYISQVGQYVDKMRKVAGPSRAVFLVQQAFAWENLRDKDRDPSMVLYPTRGELRFLQYQSIVHGANGLVYWGLYSTPPEAPLWDDLSAVTKELKELRTELAARRASLALDLEYHDTGHSLDRGIEWLAKPSRDGMALIAVNADCNPVDVTLRGLKEFRSAELQFQSGGSKLEGGALRERFEPFGARVWRLRR